MSVPRVKFRSEFSWVWWKFGFTFADCFAVVIMGQKGTKNHEEEIVDCFHDLSNQEKVEKLFQSFDVSKDGALSKKEFKEFGKQLTHLMHEEGKAKFAPEHVDSSIDQLFEVCLRFFPLSNS